MRQQRHSFRTIVTLSYMILVITMLGILLAITLGKDKSRVTYGLGEYENVGSQWKDQNGMPFQFSMIDSYKTEGSEDIWAYFEPLDGKGMEHSLMFRSKNAYVRVFVDGQPVYETDVAQHSFYNHSPGTRWNLVLVPPETRQVKMQIRLAYDDGRAKIDNFFYGDRARIVIEVIGNKLFGLFITFLILFVGILFILADVVFNWRSKQKDYSLLYLGGFAIVAALWCLLETNILQLFSPDLRILQVMDNMLLVLGSIPLFLYLDCALEIGKWKIVRLACAIDLVYITLATLSQILGLWDYHQTLNGAVTGLAVVSLAVIFGVVWASLKKRKDGKINRDYIPQQLGIIMIGLGLAGDLYRYLTSDVMDRATWIRIGLLAFIICFGAGNMRTLIKLVEQGLQAEIISKLAYSDGLTSVGNRTAYMERLGEIAGTKDKRLGIVMLDINDLKKVNDTLGHSQGDELIRICSRVIENSFGRAGETFRIGGDEFVVLIFCDKPEAIYLEMLSAFDHAVRIENQVEERIYRISIACGAGFCTPSSMEEICQAQDQADKLMYDNKAYLKEMHSKARYDEG